MATKTSAQIEAELDDLLYEPTVDAAPWTEAIKQRALNRAIRGSFPNFKNLKIDTTTVTLSSTTLIYSLSAITDIEPIEGIGIFRAAIQPTTAGEDDYIPLRRIVQEWTGTAWQLHVPSDIASTYTTQKLALYYYTRLTELLFTDVAADVLQTQFVNHVLYAAAADLVRRFMQGGSNYDIKLYSQILAEYRDKALMELQRNTVLPIPVLVARREG